MNAIQRRIVIFFLVTYALSWFGWLGNWIAPADFWPLPINALGPIIAAPLVIWLMEGVPALKAWLGRIARFRAPLWVYLAAFLVPLGIILVSVGLAMAMGAPTGTLPAREIGEWLILVPIMLILGPVTEEPAFRGFGQHELQATTSPLSASLLIGVGVLIWHLPVLLLGDIPWPLVFVIPAVSVIYAWLYQMGASVWPLVLLHFTQNYFGGEYFQEMFPPNARLTYIGILSVIYIAWALLIAARFGPSLRGARTPRGARRASR